MIYKLAFHPDALSEWRRLEQSWWWSPQADASIALYTALPQNGADADSDPIPYFDGELKIGQEDYADEGDNEDDLVERWTPRFKKQIACLPIQPRAQPDRAELGHRQWLEGWNAPLLLSEKVRKANRKGWYMTIGTAPLNDAIIVAVAQLVDDAQTARRDPSHYDIESHIRRHGLLPGDPNRNGQTVGKAKRVRAVLLWALENAPQAGGAFITSLVSTLKGYGGFRTGSPNYVGQHAIANSKM